MGSSVKRMRPEIIYIDDEDDDDYVHQSCKYLPEDIVVDILVRLPMKFLFRLKIVSKLWKSTVSNPKFAQNYLQRYRSSFKSVLLWELLSYTPIQVLNFQAQSFDIGPAQLPFLACLAYNPSYMSGDFKGILASSNGLILSSSFNSMLQLSVSNPLTKQSVELPFLRYPHSFNSTVVGLATSHARGFGAYKVVLIMARDYLDAGSANSRVHIFSSDTGSWTRKELLCPQVVFMAGRGKTYTCNGVLHWFDSNTSSMVTYDPFGNDNQFGRIPLPTNGSGMDSVKLIHLGHEDVMKYGEIEMEGDVTTRRLCVWRLVDYDKEEWCLEKTCLISPKVSLQYSSEQCYRFLSDHWIENLNGHLFEASLDPSEVMALSNTSVIPIALCPWSSPFYGQAG